MRIQHNIMAMNAYRNYTNNVSAMKANLEKLSSGYKINRAGDDAAGLAISEKMRAQITGLETAQKNAKDGISLVQTAEGALTEVHDMLNRMVELATQSANGTYDNTTDRNQLQKEMDQLKKEIDRIADSANFNGIKLLDGSMDSSVGKEIVTTIDPETTTMDASFLPVKGGTLGTNTVLHQNANNGTQGTTFSVDLHNTVFGNNAANAAAGTEADKLTFTVGDETWELEGDGNGALKGEDLVNAIVDKINEKADADGNVVIDGFKGQKFKVTAGTGGDNRITFQQVSAPSGDDQVVDGDMKVSITGNIGSDTASAGKAAVKATYTIDLSNATGGDVDAGATFSDAANVATKQSKIDGVNVTFEGNIDKTMQKFVEDYNALDNTGVNNKDYVASWDKDKGVLTLTAKVAGALDGNTTANTPPSAAPALANVGKLTQNKDAVKDVQTLNLTGATQADVAAKSIDGVAIDWVNEGKDDAAKLDATMKAWVEKYNGEASKAYTASWADNKLTLTAKVAGAVGGTTTGVPAAAPTTDIKFTPATKETNTYTMTNADQFAANDTIVVNGTTYTIVANAAAVGSDPNKVALADVNTNEGLAKFIASKMSSNDYDISVNGAVITTTAKKVGQDAVADDGTTITITAAVGTNKPTSTKANNPGANIDITNTATLANPTAGADAGLTTAATAAFTEAQAGAAADADGVVVIGTADYNFKTTAIDNVTAESGGRLASTYFDLTEDMVVDGGSLTIGKQTYTFSSDAADKGAAGKVYIGDLVDAEGKVDIAGNLDEIAQRVTDAAKDNTTWTVGHDKGGATLSFVEKQGQTEYTGDDALTSVDNIAKTFSWTGVGSSTTTIEGAGGVNGDGTGKSLTLQIGDTAEEFNQLKVDIKDMHAAALGLGDDIRIDDQTKAADAIDVIKAAINKVSDVRGTLGATQNRLDHTINNLSVMTENIQDAESTIRDTDVAAEMMAYTKNNILIQSAQAMLAQANQVPQGVLQLLQ